MLKFSNFDQFLNNLFSLVCMDITELAVIAKHYFSNLQIADNQLLVFSLYQEEQQNVYSGVIFV